MLISSKSFTCYVIVVTVSWWGSFLFCLILRKILFSCPSIWVDNWKLFHYDIIIVNTKESILVTKLWEITMYELKRKQVSLGFRDEDKSMTKDGKQMAGATTWENIQHEEEGWSYSSANVFKKLWKFPEFSEVNETLMRLQELLT